MTAVADAGVPSAGPASEPAGAPRRRFASLEAVRGIAAIVVVIHHALLGFAPALDGLIAPPGPGMLFGTPLFGFVNGSAAVVVFFVLSGFVLAIGLLDRQPRDVLVAGLKRWPRLMLPVLIVNLASGAIMAAGLYANLEAGRATGSVWLQWFFAWPSQGAWEIVHAGGEGLFGTFILGQAAYNSNLWTMWYELLGSFVVFAMVLVALARPGRKALWIAIAIAWGVATLLTSYMGPFVVGFALAVLHHERPSAAWSSRALLLAPVILVLLGYHESIATGRPEGVYGWLAEAAQAVGPLRLRVLLHTAAAVAIILLALRVRRLRDALSGPVAGLIGRLSFPIYLLHFIVIASLGSWLYLALAGHGAGVAATVAIAGVVVVTAALAVPLAAIDRWWLARMRDFAAALDAMTPTLGARTASAR